MQSQMQSLHSEIKLTFILVLFAIITRLSIPPLFPHLPNFSPIDAIALFSGVYFRRPFSFFATLIIIGCSDLIINKISMQQWTFLYSGFYWQYISYLLITLMGVLISNQRLNIYLLPSSILSAILFYFISNFGVWCTGNLYPKTFDGLIMCYVAAIPFFKNTLISDLLFSSVLFGCFEIFKFSKHGISYNLKI